MRHKENLHFFANLQKFEKSSKRSGGPKRIWLIIIKSHIEKCNICEQLDYWLYFWNYWKANEFYNNTKIFLWFSNSVDFIFSCAIVYSVIDDLYQLVIRYLRDNKKVAFSFMQHNPICKIHFAIWVFPVEVLFLYNQMQMSLFLSKCFKYW